MLNVRMLREALDGLPDYANIRLDFNTSSDTLAEVFDQLELIAARRCPHTGDLVIVIDDTDHDDEDAPDLDDEDEDDEDEEETP